MRRVKALLLLGPLFLAGCGGKAEAPSARDDAQWEQAMTAGQDSFDLGRYSVAITQFRKASELALMRDDGAATAEAGYNLAVAQLAADQPADAVATIQTARQAAMLRGQNGQAAFDLVEAAADYRLKQLPQSVHLASQAMTADDSAVAARAALILGLAADEAGEASALQQANAYLQGIKPPLSRSVEADKAEISARTLMANNPAEAAQLAEKAANLRRDDAAYRDMSRALALAATATERAGDHQKAAALWARAAQSAAMQANKAASTDTTTVAHGAFFKGGTRTAESDAAQWARLAGGVSLHPFADPAKK